jgi:SNF family Na+-dependent transporter
MANPIKDREQWATRIGLILAMAGNAVGLGNFLRFPTQAATNGGGAFMIPYFISLVLLGIPMMWVEWSIGRYGGRHGQGSAPGIFSRLWNHPLAKYLGVLGVMLPLTIVIYYTYIESWTLAFSVFSATRAFPASDTFQGMAQFLQSYQGVTPEGPFGSILAAYVFFLITISINVLVLSRGIARGIELLAKIAMPILLLFAVVLVIRVFTLDFADPPPPYSVSEGIGFMWNPDFSQLRNSSVWLAAAGQVFFTLSIGTGSIITYASYLRAKDDIALTGFTTSMTNEFCEIVLGGSIAIPVAVAYFGLIQTQQIAAGGSFDLAFLAMPVIFQKLPAGALFGSLWFLLLFFAGITSSVALATPAMAFFQDELGMTRRKAALVLGMIMFICCQPIIFLLKYGFMDEFDFWSGTFGLVVFCFLEVTLFAWVFGMDKAWKEITAGADIRVPRIFYYIIKYVTPLFLGGLLVTWFLQSAWGILILRNDGSGDPIPEGYGLFRLGARGLMLLLFVGLAVLVWRTWRNRRTQDVDA